MGLVAFGGYHARVKPSPSSAAPSDRSSPATSVTRRSVLSASALLATSGLLVRAGAALGQGVGAGPAGSPATAPATTRPARKPGTRKDVPPRMSFLANDQLKLGMDLSLGGAITHLSSAGEPTKNLVNSWDLGRQIQMSYYSGPVPYEVQGHAGPPPMWRGIGWNPIQVGDDYGNPSRVLEHRNDGRELYVKCVPMQWPLDDVPGECTFECWATLDGPAARVRCRLTMRRADRTQWPARTQELPAVYTNGPWHRLFTYAGDKPFDGDELRRIDHPFTAKNPWAHWQATERWAALVDDADWGLGVWNPDCVRLSGGFVGKGGRGGPKDGETGYLAPNRDEVLDHDLVHEYEYALVLGDLKAIRAWVYAQPDRPAEGGRPARSSRPDTADVAVRPRPPGMALPQRDRRRLANPRNARRRPERREPADRQPRDNVAGGRRAPAVARLGLHGGWRLAGRRLLVYRGRRRVLAETGGRVRRQGRRRPPDLRVRPRQGGRLRGARHAGPHRPAAGGAAGGSGRDHGCDACGAMI